MHIKARLQLLRNGGQSTGMPNQQNAPVPQDVHPQQYQAAGVGAPPGPQWGVPAPVLHGSNPSQNGSVPEWNRRLADIPNPPPPQPPSLYDQREPLRGPPSQRQMSPRQDQMRQFQEPHRHTPLRRGTPPPPVNHGSAMTYSTPQALPQPQPSIPPQPAPNRIPNPNYVAAETGLRLATNNAPVAPGPRAPYGRGDSPPPEIKPIAEPRPVSPGPSYPQQHYQQHHPNTSQSVGIAAGAPPPAAALAAAEAAAREHHDRPIAGFKRGHESDDDYKFPNKHPANGESRSRLDDYHHRRHSPPERYSSPGLKRSPPSGRPQSPYGRPASPPISRHSRSSSAARREDRRRADETYHPSEAAHHPPTLPSMNQAPVEPPQTPASEVGREERRDTYEAAARKMEVDEDYDEEGEDQKRKEERNSPQHNGVNGPPKVEVQA